ncbi:hypothetical protein D3C86_1758700 [compost metagenome]
MGLYVEVIVTVQKINLLHEFVAQGLKFSHQLSQLTEGDECTRAPGDAVRLHQSIHGLIGRIFELQLVLWEPFNPASFDG